jgi:alkylation response protein AidB-like acyl-CoA dehydrogenase
MHLFLGPVYQERFLPALLKGEAATCFALTEPDAGSGVWMIRTGAAWQRLGHQRP